MYRDHQLSSRNNLGQQSALEALRLLHSTEPFEGLVCRSVSQSVSGGSEELRCLVFLYTLFCHQGTFGPSPPPPSSGLLGDYLQSSPNKHPGVTIYNL